jgi:hypothetical protein
MNRNEYLAQLIDSKVPQESRAEIDSSEWWWIPVEDNWRLTWLGYASFVDLGVESWEFDFGSSKLQLPSWVYLKLSRNLKVPYYIVDNKKHNLLVVFDSREAVAIKLFGSLDRWLARL